MKSLQYELVARADVIALAPGFSDQVVTDCQAVRVRNEGPDAITLNVGGQPFPLAAGRTWGFDTGQHNITIRQVLIVRVPETDGQLVFLERIFLTPLTN